MAGETDGCAQNLVLPQLASNRPDLIDAAQMNPIGSEGYGKVGPILDEKSDIAFPRKSEEFDDRLVRFSIQPAPAQKNRSRLGLLQNCRELM